jgi:hypothetical protein
MTAFVRYERLHWHSLLASVGISLIFSTVDGVNFETVDTTFPFHGFTEFRLSDDICLIRRLFQ